jgi:hypothetical protein
VFGLLHSRAAAQGDDVDWVSDTLLKDRWPKETVMTKKIASERKHHSILVFCYCLTPLSDLHLTNKEKM